MIRRRDMLCTGAAALAVAPIQARASGSGARMAPHPQADTAGWRDFEITTSVSLQDAPGAAQLWLPLAQTAGGYQVSRSVRWQGNGTAAITRDDHYGAGILRIDWTADAATAPKTIQLVQVVATRDRGAAGPMVAASEVERRFWTQPTDSLPTDGIVRATAERIVAGRTDPKDRLRALYDWVVDQTSRDPKTPGCGTGNIRSMLTSGHLGGKCADINSLMTGLARSVGFPARDVYGIRVAASTRFPQLGANGTVSKAQHCRSEVYLEDAGWFPVDPADVRKLMLERHLRLDDPEIVAARERLFGNWEMNWVGFNSATDIVLPGAPAGHTPNFPFLMYPCALTSAGQPDCLDADRFRYEITSRDVTA
ncbi:transglutaminase-like domain-containing protein [Lichenicola sp.]|uniref:transglutaminase-like domain-containing protein n=1 Tax=Lichenicola sp. TaxID=2804529 RepID=UPI003B0089C9